MASPSSQSMLIAVDMDDVLSQTNKKICELHNAEFGTNMTLDDFLFYHYWQNIGWGTIEETVRKVKSFYARGLFQHCEPIDGAYEGLMRLKKEVPGVQLCLVTARGESERPGSEAWIEQHFPGVFDHMHFTGAFTTVSKEGEPKQAVKYPKSEVLHRLGARLLIDDALENAIDCANASPPVPVLLFGDDYPWNKRFCGGKHPERDKMTYDEWTNSGIWTKENTIHPESEFPKGVHRVAHWDAVVDWIKKDFGILELQ